MQGFMRGAMAVIAVVLAVGAARAHEVLPAIADFEVRDGALVLAYTGTRGSALGIVAALGRLGQGAAQ